MKPTLMLCIPGDWEDRTDLVVRMAQASGGQTLFLGGILAKPSEGVHVHLDLVEHTPRISKSFRVAGQGKLSEALLQQVAEHRTVAYLHFDISFILERSKLTEFSRLMQSVGGIAVKVESTGLAHDWETWHRLTGSDSSFDWYCSMVVLIKDTDAYYSCGMHHFLLEDVEVPSDLGPEDGADLINQFNFWRINEEAKIANGHTFSLSKDSPRFRMKKAADHRHEPGDLFHNTHGVWRLERVPV